jgi:Mitochondrial carrier protein
VLGAMSKSLATIMTQPLIVAKVGLQSKPPPSRNGKPFTSFIEVMKFIIDNEGAMSLFKGIGPQILKGLLVQGILMMTKERYFRALGKHEHICSRLTCEKGRAHVHPLLALPQDRPTGAAQERHSASLGGCESE